jgi:hypothetical protein
MVAHDATEFRERVMDSIENATSDRGDTERPLRGGHTERLLRADELDGVTGGTTSTYHATGYRELICIF